MKKTNEEKGKKIATGTIYIAPPNYGIVQAIIGNFNGEPSLIVNKRKTIPQTGDKKVGQQTMSDKQKYGGSIYYMPGSLTKYGLPASGFKLALCTAALDFKGMNRAKMKRLIFVMEDDGGMVELKGKTNMRKDSAVIWNGKNRVPIETVRAEFKEWEVVLNIRYNADILSSESVINLLAHAGQTVGWGELRLEKGYDHGGWSIKSVKIINPKSMEKVS